ncbi:MAG: VCBS repeat-containing protein [Roseobacter sp.]|jgi:hypothetical protein|nr:VCBS repeat-containing protein [Roseobacter sp.]
MPNKAQRLPARLWRRSARCALLALCLWPAGLAATAAQGVDHAAYEGLTDRYPHAVLGDDLEYETLVITLRSGKTVRFTLPQSSVFEDTAPRLVDLDADGSPEVVTVESHQDKGARLVVYNEAGRLVATPYIGTRFRWLAPLGAADLDGDGTIEIAYVDRPHLAKTLRIWRYDDGTLTQIASRAGLTNHRIGEKDIAGGIRDCGAGPEMILADSTWSSMMLLRLEGGHITSEAIASETTRAAFAKAMACTDAS